MPALNFKNNTGQSKFTGTINYQGFNYDYIIYLTPLINPIEKQEIVSYFGNRKYKGKLCLEIDENRISESLDNDDISAFFIVNFRPDRFAFAGFSPRRRPNFRPDLR